MNIKIFTLLILAGLTIIFVIQNVAVVELRFLFWEIAMSRVLMFPFLILIGILIGWLLRGQILSKH